MFEPLLEAPLQIQIHAVAAIVAMGLGPVALYRKRRDRLHKMVGYVWFVAMAAVVGSSFFIFRIQLIGPFSPIHALSIFAGFQLVSGLRAALRRDISRHLQIMKGLYFGAMGVAGVFTLMPGRIMARILFGEHQLEGFITVLVLAGLGFGLAKWRGFKRRDVGGSASC